MNRRSFMAAILAASVAPAVVKAGILMPVRPRILLPWQGDLTLDARLADDTAYVQDCLDRGIILPKGVYRVSAPPHISRADTIVSGVAFIFTVPPPHYIRISGNADRSLVENCRFSTEHDKPSSILWTYPVTPPGETAASSA